MYDAIIVGARCAGSVTAMLLARKGYKVLLLDRATFPSDTLSTHQIQVPGGAALKRWGLLDRLRATNPGAVTGAKLDVGPVMLKGSFPAVDGVNSIYGPRRTILDKMLVDAAVEAGAELREDFLVEDLVSEDNRVCGIRGHAKAGSTSAGSITEKARVVVGADGKHSMVAAAVNASKSHESPVLTCAYYGYFEGIPLEIGEMYQRDRRSLGIWPTNDGLTVIYVAWPITEFHQFRSDLEANFMRTVDLVPDLAERVRAGRRVERLVGTADLPNFFRKPQGPGWVLVGDAGFVRDPITAMGISDAFRDAELLMSALDEGFAGRKPIEQALGDYEKQRDAAALPMYEFALDLARMGPPSIEQQALFEALQNNQEMTDQFFGVITGAISPKDFFSGRTMMQVLGIGGMAKLILGKMFAPRKSTSQPVTVPQT